jgi:hypothetical protein
MQEGGRCEEEFGMTCHGQNEKSRCCSGGREDHIRKHVEQEPISRSGME